MEVFEADDTVVFGQVGRELVLGISPSVTDSAFQTIDLLPLPNPAPRFLFPLSGADLATQAALKVLQSSAAFPLRLMDLSGFAGRKDRKRLHAQIYAHDTIIDRSRHRFQRDTHLEGDEVATAAVP